MQYIFCTFTFRGKERSLGDRKHIICVCGYPYAGKSLVGTMLHERYGWTVIEAERVAKAILESDAKALYVNDEQLWEDIYIYEIRAYPYPYPEVQRIEWERQDLFEQALLDTICASSAPIIIVGIRNAGVIRSLRDSFGRGVQVLYVARAERNCLEAFVQTAKRPKSQYRALRTYAIEADQDELRRASTFVLVNAGTKEKICARLFERVHPDGMLVRSPLEVCSSCGTLAPVHQRIPPNDEPVCKHCYEVQQEGEVCSSCGVRRLVHVRTEDGRPVCKVCYQRRGNIQRCIHCKRLRPVHHRNIQNQPVCRKCHRHYYRRKKNGEYVLKCSECGIELRRIPNDRFDHPLCDTCREREGYVYDEVTDDSEEHDDS